MRMAFVLVGFCCIALAFAGVLWLRGHVRLAWNETESLPQSWFWVRTDQKPGRGDYAMFRPPESLNSPYGFIKKVSGIGGDKISVEDRLVRVAGTNIRIAKKTSLRGQPLHAIAPGLIPRGFYFVHTNHRDSYDSRYKSIGLVPDADIIGRATPLF